MGFAVKSIVMLFFAAYAWAIGYDAILSWLDEQKNGERDGNR